MYATVLWATDGTARATAALPKALELLAPEGTLIAAHIDQRFVGSHLHGVPVYPDEIGRIERIQAQVEELREEGTDARLVVEPTSGSPVAALAAIAEEAGVDVIVCGARGGHAVLRVLEGSFSSRLVHESSVPVVVVPSPVRVRRHRATNEHFVG